MVSRGAVVNIYTERGVKDLEANGRQTSVQAV